MALIDLFNPGDIKSTGGASASSGFGNSLIAGGVLSGLTDIATGYINAQRTKRTYAFNAKMAQLQGRMMRLAADQEIKKIRQKAASIYSSQRAGYAKAGISFSEGSPLQVALDSQREAELDVIYTNINAEYGMGSQETQAGIYRTQGSSAGYDANTNALKSILQMGVKHYARG